MLLVALIGCQRPAAETMPAQSGGVEGSGYVAWLEAQSMLLRADQEANRLEAKGEQWRNPYSAPRPRDAVKLASVWLLHYPGAVITGPGQSVIATYGDPRLWDSLREIGVEMLHTCPTKRAGGVRGYDYTPTIDGWFDRIMLQVDPQLGTDEEYRQMVKVAGDHGGMIAGDLVPLHTGMGADFRLAERNYKDYPGMYTMVEIRREDWPLLPDVPDPWETALVSKDVAIQLTKKAYLPGLITSADGHPDARNWSGWSATGTVDGVDGRPHRWVYLHVFKPHQPTLNWFDPSFAARRVVIGDATHSLHDLGDRMLRLDAVPFLGVEPIPGQTLASYYMNPLSVEATDNLAFMIRKLGGWSFEELNVPLEQFKEFTKQGADLSYDFFTRAQVLHPLLSGDARVLRVAHRLLLQFGVPEGTLIHDLQNHDEITYQLVDLGSRKEVDLGGERANGEALKEQILQEMRATADRELAPQNKLYRPEQDGIATTFAGFAAAGLGIRDPYQASQDQVAQIQRAHLLFAHANAMQPGVFALSSWDLVGALPIPEQSVAELTRDGDYRWVNRGGVDLLGANPEASRSAFGLPRAKSLYGSLLQQLESPDSFASQLRRMLAGRKKYRIAEAETIAVPDVSDRAVCVLIMRLPDTGDVAITALSYRRDSTTFDVDLSQLPGISADQLRGRAARDIVTEQDIGSVTNASHLTMRLDGISGRTVVIQKR
ncbi:MAG: trehalose synthase [Myxococcales bacterium]|nr:trehalose synthase [Myxococcales bacterium]